MLKQGEKMSLMAMINSPQIKLLLDRHVIDHRKW